MDMLPFFVLSVLLLLCTTTASCQECKENSQLPSNSTGASRVLSRKKRFLIFPEGSSLQLVFCVTYPLVTPLSDIVIWGNTAALAWELPQDPYSPFEHHADPLHRRKDDPTSLKKKKKSGISPKNVIYIDKKGKLLFKVPYKRKAIVNPAFGKRSVENTPDENLIKKGTQPEEEIKLLRSRMHERQATREFLKIEHLGDKTVEFHRKSRKGLFEKMEVFLKALGMNGRECVMKMLCVVGQTSANEQGSFVEELVRAVFTLPRGQDFSAPRQQEYDLAYGADENCSNLFPECEDTDRPLEIMLY